MELINKIRGFLTCDSDGKTPATHASIFKSMCALAFGISGIYLIANLIKQNFMGAIFIGAAIAVLAISLKVMQSKGTSDYTKYFFLSMALVIFVFLISLFSGASYSDDFLFFLSIIGLSGFYLEPKLTKAQIILADICLVLMLIIHPEKAHSISDFLICLALFNLASTVFRLTIRRGKQFTDVATNQARESEELLAIFRDMGDKIQKDFESSSVRIEDNTQGLEAGSDTILTGTEDVTVRCNEVQKKFSRTTSQIRSLSGQVRSFESALSENKLNIQAMQEQLNDVEAIIRHTDIIFEEMKEQMNEVSKIAVKLSDISFKTTLLSLNASVEAVHAGSAGKGFAVVATEMKQLSENSEVFAEQVTVAVNSLLNKVELSAEQFQGSAQAILDSQKTMDELQTSFNSLTDQFNVIYSTIEEQNSNIVQVDDIFSSLTANINNMRQSSESNQNAITEIVKSMESYRVSVKEIVDRTRRI